MLRQLFLWPVAVRGAAQVLLAPAVSLGLCRLLLDRQAPARAEEGQGAQAQAQVLVEALARVLVQLPALAVGPLQWGCQTTALHQRLRPVGFAARQHPRSAQGPTTHARPGPSQWAAPNGCLMLSSVQWQSVVGWPCWWARAYKPVNAAR